MYFLPLCSTNENIGSWWFKYGQWGERKQIIDNFYFLQMSLHYVRVMSCECIVHIKYYLVFIPCIYSLPYNITY